MTFLRLKTSFSIKVKSSLGEACRDRHRKISQRKGLEEVGKVGGVRGVRGVREVSVKLHKQ